MRRLVIIAVLLCVLPVSAEPEKLRVCADPNNLPFSNDRGEGFEDELARMFAKDLGRDLQYVYWAGRRGFLRNTLLAGRCDVVMSVPSSSEVVSTTRPYYRSSYVFVTRKAAALHLRSLADPQLRALKIGVPIVGDDYANTPPAQALAEQGLVNNLVGFSVYGDYQQDTPPAELIRAVARGSIDLAIAWGPLAGYFARRSAQPLQIEIASSGTQPDSFVFSFSLGVRRNDPELRRALERILTARRQKIAALLARYGIPQV